MGEREKKKKKSRIKWSAFIVKEDCPLCYSTCLSRRCDLEKVWMEEENKQGTEMKDIRLKKFKKEQQEQQKKQQQQQLTSV